MCGMNKTIIANWKANPATLAEAQELFEFSISEAVKYPNLQLVICPPFVYLNELAKELVSSNHKLSVSLGAQDLFWDKAESTDMLHPVKSSEAGAKQFDGVKNFGVTHVLVGHSDRRYKIGETDEVINKKIKAALGAGIMPVLLVGEKNRGDDPAAIIEAQLVADLNGLTVDQIAGLLIAYEPVWAISTTPGSEPDTPTNTLEVIEVIKKFLMANFQFLYGGSINQNNVSDFLSHPEISGAVIGGASLRKEEFAKILKIVNNIK